MSRRNENKDWAIVYLEILSRELSFKYKVEKSPYIGKYLIIIIDEFHWVNESVFESFSPS